MIPFSNREMKRNEKKKQKMRYKIRFYYTTYFIQRDYSLYTTLIVSLPLDNNLQLQLQCSNNTTISLLLFLAFDSIFFFISKMRRKKSQKWFFLSPNEIFPPKWCYQVNFRSNIVYFCEKNCEFFQKIFIVNTFFSIEFPFSSAKMSKIVKKLYFFQKKFEILRDPL